MRIIRFNDKNDNIWFEYSDSAPKREGEYKFKSGKKVTFNIALLFFYMLYRNTVYHSYGEKTDLAKDIKDFPTSEQKYPFVRFNEPLHYYTISACWGAMQEWVNPSEKTQAYIAYQDKDGEKQSVGFILFNEKIMSERPVVYIGQLGVTYRGSGIGRRLMECVLMHYPPNTEFTVLTRKFNTEAIILYGDHFKFESIEPDEVEQLGLDERYVGFRGVTTQDKLSSIQAKTTTLVDVSSLSQKHCSSPILCHLGFATNENFIGRPIKGYNPEKLQPFYMTQEAAMQLCAAQNEFIKQGFTLRVYDSYRPKRAVEDFWDWACAKSDPSENEIARKPKHYPLIPKSDFFKLGYVVKDSTHTRGNTVDVELLDEQTRRPLFMGARISYMGKLSHSNIGSEDILEQWQLLKEANQFSDIQEQWKLASGEDWDDEKETDYANTALKNRELLSSVMQKCEMRPYEYEWWHYTGVQENNEALDIPVSAELSLELCLTL